jgi:formylglycine-generating enzyme required for sulfatase activity
MKFVYVPPGSFMMGSPKAVMEDDSDEIQHRVTLTKGFFMGVMEVTQGQWKAVMANNPSYFKNSGDDYPVEEVSWNDAQAFIRSLNRKEGVNKYRLPTEAEWEYACRAGTTTPFYTGNCISTDEVNYDGHYPMPECPKGQDKNKTVRAGSYLPNSFGLYDMHGNVWEWCQDWYGFYPVSHVTDPKGLSSGKWRVFRGGSWNSNAWDSRSAARSCGKTLYRQYGLGFRVARDL